MITKRILVMGADSSYYDYTMIALRSFQGRNPGWSALVMDVGLTPAQASSLRRIALVAEYPREEFRGAGRYIPSAKARCLALAQLPDADTLMLYLDGDTVTLGSVEPMVGAFLDSGLPIGIGREDDRRFSVSPARLSWLGGEAPPEFPNRLRWQDYPVLNTGVLLATGRAAAEVGRWSSEWYEGQKDRYLYGEQTIINAAIYENDIKCFNISTLQHCFLPEACLTKAGRPYVDPVYLDGEAVLIRHFCLEKNKRYFEGLKADLMAYYGPPEDEVASDAGVPGVVERAPRRRPHPSNPLKLPKPKGYYRSPRGGVAAWVAALGISAQRVLEIGCSSGAAGRVLKHALGADYYAGIDKDAVAARAARANLDEAFVADLDTVAPEGVGLPEGGFDLLVALDVLEHLQDPWDLLADLVRILRPGGGMLLSIPNVQNVAVLEGLSRGVWKYSDCGLLDATHLRFFTWDGIKDLLEGAGLAIAASRPLFRPPLDVDNLPEDGNTLRLGRLTLDGLSKRDVIRFHAWQYFVYARLR